MRELLIKKDELFKKGIELKNLSMIETKNSMKIREEKDKTFKEYNFVSKLIKAMEEVK